jgi:signal transduction histidine kinase
MRPIVNPLQQHVLKASEREQARIGQELHDGLGQHLTGIAFMAKALAHRLAAQGVPEAADAEKLVQLINRSVSITRGLSHGLRPVGVEDNALMAALRQFALDVADLYKIDCQFVNDAPVLIKSPTVSHHLFRIAQEAVNNAIKHGEPKRIVIELDCGPSKSGASNIVLSISNDGRPFESEDETSQGMGLAGMRYRAKLISARLTILKDRRPLIRVRVSIDSEVASTLVEPKLDGEREHD